MFTVTIESCFWASHQILLPDGSKEKSHAHNWKIAATIQSQNLDDSQTVLDFHILKDLLNRTWEQIINHNNALPDNASAEMVAKYVYEILKPMLKNNIQLESITATEQPGCSAKYHE